MTITNVSQDLHLEPDQFHRLRDIIYEKSGIFFAENKLYLLENRLGRRIKNLIFLSIGSMCLTPKSPHGIPLA